MKTLTKTLCVCGIALLASCGMSEEAKNKIIDEAVSMRAKQVCENGGYEEKMEYLTEQLTEQGLSETDINKAIDAYEKKVKETCPDKVLVK